MYKATYTVYLIKYFASKGCFLINFFQAKPYLEKAMKLDPSFLEAVYIMVEILGQEQQYDRGIEM